MDITIEYLITTFAGPDVDGITITANIEGTYRPADSGGRFEPPSGEEIEVGGHKFDYPTEMPMSIRLSLVPFLEWVLMKDHKEIERQIRAAALVKMEADELDRLERREEDRNGRV